MPKLYKSRVYTDVVVCMLDDSEPSDEVLELAAVQEIRENCGWATCVDSVDEVQDEGDLPSSWDGRCLPWCAEGNEIVKSIEKSIGEILKSINNDV